MTFIVEGRRFDDRTQAITFAMGLAEESDRSVDVKVETIDGQNIRRRTWMCRMHPPGVQRTLIPEVPLPHVRMA